MKALVYHGPGQKNWEEKEKPVILKSTDAIVRVLRTTICGTDLHIMKGDVPSVVDGRTLGHEGMGVIDSVGEAVNNFKIGDRVLISCITSCGKCEYCKRAMYSHCEDGGWQLGNTIDGVQAEYVRIPHADNSLYAIPSGADEEAMVMLSDIFPTGFEIGVLNGSVQPGDTVAIVGSGPIGLAALLTAQFFSPSRIIMIDSDTNRLEVARQLGATDTLDPTKDDISAWISANTKDGVDVAIEAVGVPATFDTCQTIIRPGGTMAVVGVHGKSVDFQVQNLWIKNITLRTGLVNTNTTALLMKTVLANRLNPDQLITHRFQLSEIEHAYEVFGHAADQKALKVLLLAD